MSENNYHKVSSWKLILVLMLIVWMINVLMSFVYKTQPNFFMFTWLTNIFLCFVETVLVSIICYVFYLLFFKHRNRDKEEDNDAQ
jgi:predicted membrane protein